MVKRPVFILVLMFMLLSFTACSPATSQSAPSMGAEPGFAAPEMERGATDGGFEAPAAPSFEQPMESPAVDNSVGGGGEADVQRLVIRNANMTIVVADPGASMSAIGRKAEEMGGYIVTSNLYKSRSDNGVEYPEANITVRVPAEKLGETLDAIKGLTKDPKKDVLAENVSGQDVTKEYTDLQSRLKNLEETEAQLREIMGSATRTEDVLMVYNQLVSIREQIEVIKGQIQYYRESADLSSVSVLLRAAESVQPLEVGGWQPVGVARDALQALINGMQVLGSAVIWLGLFILPLLAVIVLPIVLLVWLLRRNRKPKMRAPQPPVTPAD